MSTKRGFLITDPLNKTNTYNTASNGWTLSAWELTPAETITNYIDVPGRARGPLDLSTAQTDGRPVYGNRTLTITLECSEGTRADRILKIKELTRHTGYQRHIVTPDDTGIHLVGRIISVKENYNDLAHAQVFITAVCEPYKQADEEHVEILQAAEYVFVPVVVGGDRPVIPTVEVTGATGTVRLEYGLAADRPQWDLVNGTYVLPALLLQPGRNDIVLSGLGTVKLTFTEVYL